MIDLSILTVSNVSESTGGSGAAGSGGGAKMANGVEERAGTGLGDAGGEVSLVVDSATVVVDVVVLVVERGDKKSGFAPLDAIRINACSRLCTLCS